jgi:hypothetical protein
MNDDTGLSSRAIHRGPQLATLCARLNLSGHGITTPPGSDLPEPWLSVLTQYQHRETGAAPVRDGCAAAAAVLPELDGIQLTILGLHNCQDSTIMHMHRKLCYTPRGTTASRTTEPSISAGPRAMCRAQPHQSGRACGRRGRR